jgi:T4-like virus tail tube protein gp19
METMLTRNSYAAGNFELRVDGCEPTAYVKSVGGGWSRANIGNEAVGSHSQRVKHITSVEIEPITVEFGLAGAKDMLRWIQKSWKRKDDHRRNGQITYADFDMRAMFEHQFYRALITETTFPTLDGASKEGGYLTCKLQPESADTTALGAPGPRISSNLSPLQKMWTPAAFRLNIDGIGDMQYVNKINSFTVTMETKKLYAGASRLPDIVPLNIKFPNISGTISLKYADKLLQWYKDYIRTQEGPGTKDSVAQKSGSIEFLSPDRKQTLLRIKLCDVGPVYVGADSSKANEEQIKRLKFELYVERMDIEGSSILGFV